MCHVPGSASSLKDKETEVQGGKDLVRWYQARPRTQASGLATDPRPCACEMVPHTSAQCCPGQAPLLPPSLCITDWPLPGCPFLALAEHPSPVASGAGQGPSSPAWEHTEKAVLFCGAGVEPRAACALGKALPQSGSPVCDGHILSPCGCVPSCLVKCSRRG